MAVGSVFANDARGGILRARVARRTGQRGDSLIEVLVVIFVMGLLFPAAAMGLLTVMKLSSQTHVSQRLNAGAASYVETLKDITYVDCAGPNDYKSSSELWTPPASNPMTVEITGVEHWNETKDDFFATSDADDPCPEVDQGSQRISVKLTASDGEATMQVVKRDPHGAPPDEAP